MAKNWLDKYDAPQAQNGIEGTMGGLTDKGFNYNGAWGGPSMNMGGNIPGSVGFTYARTKGIPSEGPYGKKTVPSAQDGKTIDSNQEFLKNWYSKRKIEDPYIQEAFELDRPAYMKNLQSMPEYTMVENIDNDPNITGRYESDKNKLLITKNAPEHVKTHELNHYLNNLGAGEYMRSIHKDIVRNELLPQSQMQGVYKDKYNYFSDPDEVHSRIMVLRQKAGFKPNETITPEKLKGFMKIYKGDVDNINDLLNMSKGEQGLLNMLNFMAKGTSYTPTIAQNGGEMQFYQNGLDWTPRNISEYGSEIPMGQKGKKTPDYLKGPAKGDVTQRGNQQLKTEIPARLSKERKAEEKVQKLVQYKNYDEKAARRAVQNKTKAGERDLKEIQRVETRAAAHPDYKPESSYQQMQALSDAGDLRSRILRGANLLTNQGTPLDFVTSAVTAPVTAGTNLLLNPQKYINPEEGIAGNIANLGFDLMDIIPGGAVVGTVGKTARQVGKQAAKELTQTGTANLSKKLAKTKDQLSAAFKGTDSVLEQFTGELLRGRANRRSIKEGNTWLENWINHPATQAKIDKDVDNALNFSQFLKDPESNIKELELIRNQSKNFTPVSKEYSLFKQADDNLQQYFGRNITPIHNDNWGVSYMHGYSPMTREAIDKGIVNPNDRYGSWISRTPFLRQDKRIGTTIHEGTHDWVSSEAFQKSGMRNEVLNVMNPEIKNDFLTWEKARFNRTDPSDILGKERAYQAYLADPTEMHARVMELRKHLGLSPDDVLDEDYGGKTIDYLKKLPFKKQPIDVQGFLNVIDDDPKKLSHLLNRLWAASPYAVPTAVGLGAVASGAGSEEVPQQKKGGVVKDNDGYWNPDNWGKVVEIGSNEITMEGVPFPLLAIADTGEERLMFPGENHIFDNASSVIEIPPNKIARQGVSINKLDEQPLKRLDDLLNFTNYNRKAKNGGWLDKY